MAPVDEEVGRQEAPNPPLAAPEAPAAPRAEETQRRRLKREARDLAAAWQNSRQLGQPLGESGLASGSNVGAPVWGTKAQLWPRLVHAEARRELQKREEAWLADRARERAEAGGQGELCVPRAPEEPWADERTRHEGTRLPQQPWCAWCVMERGRAKPHLQRPVGSEKVREFEMGFCYLLKDPRRRHQHGDQAVATTLVMVGVAAQNPISAALIGQV